MRHPAPIAGGDGTPPLRAETVPGTVVWVPSLKEKLEVRGMEGYCVEEDRSIAINGEPDHYACRTFLPIDHVSGSVDVTNIVKGAAAIELALERNSIQWYCSEPLAGPTGDKQVRLSMERTLDMGTTWSSGGVPLDATSGFLKDQDGNHRRALQPFLNPNEYDQPPG